MEVVRRIAELVGISSRTWGTADSYYLRVMGTVLALTVTLFLSDAGGLILGSVYGREVTLN